MQKVVETIPETVTPAAVSFAQEQGLTESLMRAKELVRQAIPFLRALSVDLEEDPDEGGYPHLRFRITVAESVERVLELNDALERAFCAQIPAGQRMLLSYTYEFQ